MDCQAINREDLAEKYLRHRLDEVQTDEFETHLLECPKCAHELELLQAVQTDLAERAHEIRGWTASKPGFFRWQIVVLAGIVIVVANNSSGLGNKCCKETSRVGESANPFPDLDIRRWRGTGKVGKASYGRAGSAEGGDSQGESANA
jgi:hypothetical protein